MKTIYIDSDFKCHTTNDGAMVPVDTDAFEGKCATYIEGYRFVPSGETWAREDGVMFTGEMIAPWRDIRVLEVAQKEYEKFQDEAEDMREALALLGVTVDE